jgi:hypothetical protein
MDLPQKRPFKRPRDVFTYTTFPFGCNSILTAGCLCGVEYGNVEIVMRKKRATDEGPQDEEAKGKPGQ